MQFKDLKIGDTFDFVNPAPGAYNSFYDTCVKLSARRYRSLLRNLDYSVGSVSAEVYHVNETKVEDYNKPNR